MPGYTISEAARLCGVNRRTLQRAIQAGRLPLTVEHLVDTADLRRAGYTVPVPQEGAAPAPQEARHAAAVPQDTPQELPLVTALLAHLEQLTRTIVALHQEVILLREDLRQTPQRRRGLTPHDVRHTAWEPQGDAAPVPHHEALAPQETPQADAAGTPRHVTSQPQEPPQDVTPVAAVPRVDTAPVPHHAALTPRQTPQPTADTDRGDTGEGFPFDRTKYRLGKLCPRGHDYQGTGQSLRVNNKAGYCIACNVAIKQRKREQARQVGAL